MNGLHCGAVRPGTDKPACILTWPHQGRDHRSGIQQRWATTQHGDPGHIVDVALRFEGKTLVDRVAISLMVAWGRAEASHPVSRYPVSHVASFADMARAVIDQFAVTDVDVSRGAEHAACSRG